MRTLALSAVFAASVAQADDVSPATIVGCWDKRDTQAEIERRAEDPYYASEGRYCFDEGGPGQLVVRSAEFNGFQDDDGDWVNGGGDAWEDSGTYALHGNSIRMDVYDVAVCTISLEPNVLYLSDCASEAAADTRAIEDTVYDRVHN